MCFAAVVLTAAFATPALADCASALGELNGAQSRAVKANRDLNGFLDAHKVAGDYCVEGGPALHKEFGDALLSAWALGIAAKRECQVEDQETRDGVDHVIVVISKAMTSQANAAEFFTDCKQ